MRGNKSKQPTDAEGSDRYKLMVIRLRFCNVCRQDFLKIALNSIERPKRRAQYPHMPRCTIQGSRRIKIGRLCMLSGTIVCAVEDETQKAICSDIRTRAKGMIMEKENSGEKLHQGFSINHVMMTKAQDPLDLPRLDSVQNISSKKKVRQQTHNNF